jgi:aspartate kinase
MSIIVQKFGGSSVATPEKILAAARKAIRAKNEGHQVVMVVSAMGDHTDDLIDLANRITDRPSAREMDMLLSTGEQVSVALVAMAIQTLGSQAVSLTGAQIGIKTDSVHSKARIRSISTERMKRLLDAGNIIVAAGFQGIDDDFNITTLGRGGSDTTAVALAAVLQAHACEIYTDVDGVYTTDPRILPEARRMSRISYDEMLELASLGAGVMHNRSIEFGKKFGVAIHVRNSASDMPGTMIVAEAEQPDKSVSGAALTKSEALVTICDVPDRPGSSLEIFSRIAVKNITVDMIVQNVGQDGKADISFTVPKNELAATLEVLKQAGEELGAGQILSNDKVAKISVVGLGMADQTGVADKMFQSLAAANINIQMISTSEIKISVLVDSDLAQQALRVVHQVFELQKGPAVVPALSDRKNGVDAAAVADALQRANMEELAIDDVTLDQSQARVTIAGVPNTPGVAAKVFDTIAASGVFVDMIVQSMGDDHGHATLSFTVPKEQLPAATAAAQKIAASLSCLGVQGSPNVAKLSVSGVGLRSHTGVAIRMFQALSDAGINVEMVNTSEVRVNVVVDGTAGEKGLKALQQAFADALR